jgi:hypothetical protein
MQNRNKGSKNSSRGSKKGRYNGTNKKRKYMAGIGNSLKSALCPICPFPYANNLENKRHTILSLKEAKRELNIC